MKAGAVVLALWLAAMVGEIAIFAVAPPEVLGWGERPSLRPDPVFGWRLIESKTTRLRWQGYDYAITSNSLGFPGPDFPTHKPSSMYRVMTVGGGFTSAEGVDTEFAWPRVLERIMNRNDTGGKVEVLNFAVTGFGPSQYATVVAEYAPIYRPDVIVVALIPNDFRKVMTPVATQAQGIGFDLPNPNGVVSILTCRHLMQAMRNHSRIFFNESIRRRSSPQGMSFGQIWAFEKGQDIFFDESQTALEERLVTIQSAADQLGSRLVLLSVPASIQVCSPEQLRYFPKYVDLSDSSRFDLDQPQREIAESATRLDIEHHDLRTAFNRTPDQCSYHPNNLHWTVEGHRTVSEFVRARLKDGMGGAISN